MYTLNITITEVCNHNCKYCFEQYYEKNIFSNVEQGRQLKLIKDLCHFLQEKNESITLCFWGGEPFMNYEFMRHIFMDTLEYDNVRYLIYTNGTVSDKINEFKNDKQILNIANRINFRISYDGEIQNLIMRGYSKEEVLKNWRDLNNIGIHSHLWSTVSPECFKYMKQTWEEFNILNGQYDFIRYTPIIDTTRSTLENFKMFKEQLSEIICNEFDFIHNKGYSLCDWFSSRTKREPCIIDNTLTMTTNGDILNCHGAPYSPYRKNIRLGKTDSIGRLFDLFDEYDTGSPNENCEKCIATSCFMCRVIQIKNIETHKDMIDQWESCRSINKERCKYYQEIGIADRYLKNALAFNDKSILEDYKVRIHQ